jgi:CopG family nickel-responsive transcriptional regulator
MERFTISLDDKLAHEFDAWIALRGYGNRSEAVRDLLRAELETTRQHSDSEGHCIACVSYVFNHHELDLAERITSLQHEHHELTVSTMHAHLDHDHCLETVILKGATRAVQRFADAVCAQRGVHHGKVNLISVETHQPHGRARAPRRRVGHSHGTSAAPHIHLKPST